MKGETGTGSPTPRPSGRKPTGRRCGTGPSSSPRPSSCATRKSAEAGSGGSATTRARGEAGTKPKPIKTRRAGESGTSGGSTTGPRPPRPTPKPQGTIATRRKGESGSSNPSPATRRRGESGSGTKPKPKAGEGVNKTQAMIRSEMGGSTRPAPKRKYKRKISTKIKDIK